MNSQSRSGGRLADGTYFTSLAEYRLMRKGARKTPLKAWRPRYRIALPSRAEMEAELVAMKHRGEAA